MAPSIRAAMIPLTYDVAAAIRASSSTATHHGRAVAARCSTDVVGKVIGSTPTAPSTANVDAAATRPPPASTIGGSASSSVLLLRMKNDASPHGSDQAEDDADHVDPGSR